MGRSLLRILLFATFVVPMGIADLYAEDSPAPLAPHDALASLQLPQGFQASLFAAEPHIVQPIAFTFDDRGRLWVVECLSYPKWDSTGNDRIAILEDTDHDGRFDKKTLFFEHGANFVGIELGFGGVWVTATPNLLFIPDADADDRPDAPPEILLDGWDLKARHNAFNGLTWGPDGWLYGCNGILSNSLIGKPGTPESDRVAMNCGVWRYHPVSHLFETVAHGSTNPWGLDFDRYGRMFITNCVIKHMFHVVPGGHYDRMFGQDIMPHSYDLMHSCADHIHWGGGDWTSSRGGEGLHDQPGGGHAHVGAMIYQGDNWPPEYRNHLYTCNLHGRRINCDYFESHGSGVVARHGKDFLHMGDPWFRGLEVKYGPDGGVYLTDWSDTGECHDYEDIHRENGRIFKVTWGKPRPVSIDLARQSDAQLVALHRHENAWFVQHARRLLQQRAAVGTLSKETAEQLQALLATSTNAPLRLRALWTLHAINCLSDEQLASLLKDENEFVRGWAIRLNLEDRQVGDETLKHLVRLAKDDPSPVVRLELASALQRLPLSARWDIATRLVTHAEDATDPNIPLIDWYGIEPLVAADPARAVNLISHAEIPRIRQYIARRVLSGPQTIPELNRLVALLAVSQSPDVDDDILTGIREALRGHRSSTMPTNWLAARQKLSASKHRSVRDQAELLAVVFDDRDAIESLQARAANPKQNASARKQAIRALAQKNDRKIVPLLQSLLDDPQIRSAAIQQLAAFSSSNSAELLIVGYPHYSNTDKQNAINTLASRRSFARLLLGAVESGKIPVRDISAFTARQLASFKDKQIDQRLDDVWGSVRPTAEDRLARIADFQKQLTPDVIEKADLRAGRVVFNRTCASCHKLFGLGRAVGPELTGAQRTSVEYLLVNLFDPSAVVGRDYRVTLIATETGRVITGIVTREDENSVTMLTANESVVIPTAEIENRKQSKVSMMPEGQLEKLSLEEIRDLFGYLASPMQVELPQQDAS